ncbi:MAG: histidinol-phosphatase [Planctomycetota bacterium]
MPHEDRLQLAVSIAREAGDLTLKYFRAANLQVDSKRDGTPVTIADRDAEKLLRAKVGQRFPADALLGEEFGDSPGTSGYQWIFDPVDGTKSFVCGVPLYGTIVAVMKDDQPVIGVINMPALNELVYASVGGGAWLSVAGAPPVSAKVSTVGDLSDAVTVFTAPEVWRQAARWPEFERLCNASRLSRGWSDCYGCVLLATGRADVWAEPSISLWDVAAAVPIIEEAGGRYTDFAGRRAWLTGNCIATNALLHAQAIAVLNDKGGRSGGPPC